MAWYGKWAASPQNPTIHGFYLGQAPMPSTGFMALNRRFFSFSCKQKSDLTAHASYRSTFLVVRNADHCHRLPAFSIIMVRPKIADTKRGTETNRRQMHKDGTARSLLAAGLIRCLDGTIHAREGC